MVFAWAMGRALWVGRLINTILLVLIVLGLIGAVVAAVEGRWGQAALGVLWQAMWLLLWWLNRQSFKQLGEPESRRQEVRDEREAPDGR